MAILEDLRRAIESSGLSRYRIAQDTGLDQAHLSRLMSGERGLSIDALETLVDYLDMEIIIQKKHRRKGR